MRKLVKSLAAAAVLFGALLLGPVQSAEATHGLAVTLTVLDGNQEISSTGTPGAGDPDGRGFSVVVTSPHAPTTPCYKILVTRIAPATLAHIHMAPAGTNGGIVVHLTPPTSGSSFDCVTEGELLPSGAPVFVGATTVQQIFANPAGFYVNVHNAEFPAGAVRGQLH